MEQRTQEWFDARKYRITASAVGAIMGLSPHGSREKVMDRMIKEYRGEQIEQLDNVALSYGVFHESGAIVEFELETGFRVEPAPFVPYEDWLGASPDGYVSDGAIIEVKCPYSLKDGGEHKSITEQMHYYAQVQMQLLCTGYDRAYFFQWSPYSTMTETVQRDEEFIISMILALQSFWDEYLIRREKTSSVELEAMMLEYISLKNEIKNLQERQKALLDGLVALSDNMNNEIAGHKLYKTTRAGSIAYGQIVKELLPDMDLEPYRGASSEFWSVK